MAVAVLTEWLLNRRSVPALIKSYEVDDPAAVKQILAGMTSIAGTVLVSLARDRKVQPHAILQKIATDLERGNG